MALSDSVQHDFDFLSEAFMLRPIHPMPIDESQTALGADFVINHEQVALFPFGLASIDLPGEQWDVLTYENCLDLNIFVFDPTELKPRHDVLPSDWPIISIERFILKEDDNRSNIIVKTLKPYVHAAYRLQYQYLLLKN